MKIPILKDLQTILEIFAFHEKEIFLVGGCVRDSLLGKEPKDWDLTTNASPDEMIEMFSFYEVSHNITIIPTGLKHGTITLLMNEVPFEVTTYRNDGDYSNGRHPDEVQFVSSLYEDLSRRDFTINALAYHPRYGLIDNFGGRKHLELGIIKCVGDPQKRFKEDALRMLRAIRFASQLKFDIAPDTFDAIGENYELLQNVSAERIQSEFNKMLVCTPTGIGKLVVTGLMNYIVPEFYDLVMNPQDNPYHIYDMAIHTAKAMEYAPVDLTLRLTMLLHDIAKPVCKSFDDDGIAHYYGHWEKGSEMAEEILRRLKYDNKTIDTVKTLVFYHDVTIEPYPKVIRRWLNKIGLDQFKMLIEVKRADIQAHAPHSVEHRLNKLYKLEELLAEELQRKKPCLQLKDLDINGNDLLHLGYPQDKTLGIALKILLLEVIAHPSYNKKIHLMTMAKKLLILHESGFDIKFHLELMENEFNKK